MLNSAKVSPWRLQRGGDTLTLLPEPVVRLATFLMVRDARRGGAGAGLLPLSLALDDIERGTLVNWGDAEGRGVELWALHTSRRLPSRKVAAFLAHPQADFPLGTSE